MFRTKLQAKYDLEFAGVESGTAIGSLATGPDPPGSKETKITVGCKGKEDMAGIVA